MPRVVPLNSDRTSPRVMATSDGVRRPTPDDVLTVPLMAFTLVALGANVDLEYGLGIGAAIALAFIPLWARYVSSSTGIRILLAAGAAALASGVWVAWLRSATHVAGRAARLSESLALVTLLVAVCWIYWTRSRLQEWQVAVLYGVGLVLSVRPGGETYAASPWRFGFGVPVTVLILGLALAARRPAWQFAAAIVLAVVFAVNGGRSSTAMLAMAAALAVWQLTRDKLTKRRTRRLVSICVTGVLGYLAFASIQFAIFEGYLGQAAEERSTMQVETTGNLLTGGRPELGATIALFKQLPLGFGLGTLPSPSDVATAKSGMAGLGYDPDNNYVDQFMFGNGFELHSTAGDAWARYGLGGLLLVAVVAVILVWVVANIVASRRIDILVTFLALKSLWNLGFGPLSTSAVYLALALGLGLAQAGFPGSPRDRGARQASGPPTEYSR